MVSLVGLPSELIHHIVSILAANVAPSERYLHEEPSESLINSVHRPLKNLSLTCRFLHDLCFPYLFLALKANVEDISSLVAFVQVYDLAKEVESLMVYSTSSIGPAPVDRSLATAQTLSESIWPHVLAMLDAIHLRALTFLLPPAAYEDLLPYKLNVKDAWAFNISYQVLRLEQSPDATQSTSVAGPTSISNIFCARPWSHVTFNEGSSIPAYSTYEYYHKKTPSLLFPQQNRVFPIYMSARLTSFDLIGVFPMGHMASTSWFLRNMKSLRRLRTQLGPGVNSRVLDDSKALGKSQRSDLWTEFEFGYQYLSGAITVGLPQGEFCELKEFIVLDYATVGLREMIDQSVGFRPGTWDHDGEGTWTRVGHSKSTVAGKSVYP